MVKSSESSQSSCSLQILGEKRWPYDEYYFGDKDENDRRDGQGENHWTGAESIEWYTGKFVRDMMHGPGDYRWRYKDLEGAFVTYEGRFYANRMHGYGVMSYPDGRVFNGLFYKDVRWGPGVENCNLQANVGFWRGTHLSRLAWCPSAPTIAPDFTAGGLGAPYLDPYRTLLFKKTRVIGQTNSAIELLKKSGAEPKFASENWAKLYTTHCTDLESPMCHADLYESEYYNGKVVLLESETDVNPLDMDTLGAEDKDLTVFAWNNNEMMIHMMKHAYQHEKQRSSVSLDLPKVLNGPRKKYRPAAKHELDCRMLLLSCHLGDIAHVVQVINEEGVFPDVADLQGNSALMYAACGDQCDIIHFLVEAGANVDSFNDSCCTPLTVALIRYACLAQNIGPKLMLQALLPMATRGQAAGPRIAIEWLIKREADSIAASSAPGGGSRQTLKSLSKAAGRKSSLSQSQALTQQSVLVTKKQAPKIDPDYESDDDSQLTYLFTLKHQEYIDRLTSNYGQVYSNANMKLFEIEYMVITINEDDLLKPMKENKGPKPEKPKGLKEIFKSKEAGFYESCSQLSFEKQRLEIVKKYCRVLELFESSGLPPGPFLPQRTLPHHITIFKFSNHEVSWSTLRTMRIMYGIMKVFCANIDIFLARFPLDPTRLCKIQLTILQLLADGANPSLIRCPQPAVILAMASGSPEIVGYVISHGANVNEKFPEFQDYTVLDMVLAKPFTNDNLDMIRKLLEMGADATHKLLCPQDKRHSLDDVTQHKEATLLHAVLLKPTEPETEEIRNEILRLLVIYRCDPSFQMDGYSAIEIAMIKNIELLEIFTKTGADLNAIINNKNQTILVKIFSVDYYKANIGKNKFQILTDLLLYGADPLIECYDGDKRFTNIFEYARGIISAEPMLATRDCKNKDKPKDVKGKTEKAGKDKGKPNAAEDKKLAAKREEWAEYIESLTLMTDCSRLLHIRWLQATLLKELIAVIWKFKHRPWVTIMKEHNNRQRLGLWINATRCLEIWDILKGTKKKRYNDNKVLKDLLSIVQFYQKRVQVHKRQLSIKMTAAEKDIIDSDVACLMKEYKTASKLAQEIEACKKLYVKPELIHKNVYKFNVCFECALPLTMESVIICDLCQLVSFCNENCMRSNVERLNCHPCSEYLKEKYFAVIEEEMIQIDGDY